VKPSTPVMLSGARPLWGARSEASLLHPSTYGAIGTLRSAPRSGRSAQGDTVFLPFWPEANPLTKSGNILGAMKWKYAVLVLCMAALPLWAQRGGMGGGHGVAMAARGGAMAAPARGMVASRAGTVRTFGTAGRGAIGTFGRGGGRGTFGRYGFNGNRFCRGYFCNGYYGWGWPLWWDTSSDNNDYNSDAQTALQQQQQQIDELQAELMRQRYAEDAETPAYAPPPPPPPSARAPGGALAHPAAVQPEPEGPTTVLVFRDQHRVEAGNYAIAGDKLYILDANDHRTVALSDLDVGATVKANENRGVEFRLPGRS